MSSRRDDDPHIGNTVPRVVYTAHPRPWTHQETADTRSRVIYDANGAQVAMTLCGGAEGFEAAEMICNSVGRVHP